jgi:hypothetical protein
MQTAGRARTLAARLTEMERRRAFAAATGIIAATLARVRMTRQLRRPRAATAAHGCRAPGGAASRPRPNGDGNLQLCACLTPVRRAAPHHGPVGNPHPDGAGWFPAKGDTREPDPGDRDIGIACATPQRHSRYRPLGRASRSGYLGDYRSTRVEGQPPWRSGLNGHRPLIDCGSSASRSLGR